MTHHGLGPTRQHDRHDVESDDRVVIKRPTVGGGDLEDLASLVVPDAKFRLTVGPFARLDLDIDDLVAGSADQVELAARAGPIAGHDAVAELAEELCSNVFATTTEFVMLAATDGRAL